MIVPEKLKTTLQNLLFIWFESNQRPMPWRETSDPYKIWIAEIMLQQTQVITIKDYYKRFISRFPTIFDLANAKIHDVMKIWEGLGYYSRARNIHRAACQIVTEYQGRIPDTFESLIKLPGIGRYTAGAILSIAYGKSAPILDGNVVRVLTRLFHVTDNIDISKTQHILWSLAEQILPETHIRFFNEALMELGAMVCKTKNPDCVICPISVICEARRLNIQESLPLRTPKKPVPHYDVTAGIIWKGNRLLITLRPPRGLLGGLWEFPGGKVKKNESLEFCLIREIREELNAMIEIKKHLISVNHAYTHFKITLHAFECIYKKGPIKMDPDSAVDYRWIFTSELNQFAFPGADRKVIAEIEKKGQTINNKSI